MTYVVVDEVRVHVVHAVVHDGCGHILAGDSQGPGSFYVQVQSPLAIILTGVFLKLVNFIKICRVTIGRQ